ncbi:MAG: hypothetical protein V1853_04655 [bacterium]
MKFGSLIILVLSLLVSSLALAGEEGKKAKEKPEKHYPFEVYIGGHHSPSFSEVSGFPLKARSIPVHPKDDYLSGNPNSTKPLPDTTLSMPYPSSMDIGVFLTPIEYLGLGVVFTAHTSYGGGVDSEEERYQQNQYGDAGRGYGTSLRWYELSVGTWGQVSLAGYLGTPWLHIYNIANVRMRTGGFYDLSGMRLTSRMGYDRWGSDEHWKDFTLARLHEHRVFAALELGFVASKEKQPEKTVGTVFIQAMYYQPYYDFQLEAEASDLVYKQGGDHHWAFALGYSF